MMMTSAMAFLGRRVATFGLALLLGACSTIHYDVNPPLRSSSGSGYVARNLHAEDNSDGLMVMLAFSGGGYRAAAMAHAAMEVLRDTQIVWEGQPRSLLQEVDFISAVSGGSLVAASYALNRQRHFEKFEQRVLAFDLQSALVSRTVSPRGLWRQTSAHFGRGDLLQELLDERVFAGATFGALPRHRPMVYINATDMRTGDRFDFSQDQFDHLCSDLDGVPLARAVAASMAVPVLLSPITLWNHRERCPVAVQLSSVPGRATRSAYLHLLDGGLADNTGVRTAIDSVARHGGWANTARSAGLRGIRKRVFIVVNAQVNPRHADDDSPATPGLLRQLRGAIDAPIDGQSASSLHALAASIRQGSQELRQVGTDPPRGSFHLIEIGVESARDQDRADSIRHIATGLRISAEDLVRIRAFVRGEFERNAAWQELLADVGAGAARGEVQVATTSAKETATP
jgi:NTE family protein